MLRQSLAALLLVALAAAPVLAQDEAENKDDREWLQLIREADRMYYYPVQAGVETLQADVDSSFIAQVQAQFPTFKQYPLNVRFFFEAPDKARFKVEVEGIPKNATAKAFLQGIEGIFLDREHLVIPRPMAPVVENFKATRFDKDNMVLIHGVATTDDSRLRMFKMLLDPLSLRVKNLIQEFRSGTTVTSAQYMTRDGLYLLKNQRLDFKQFVRESTLEWERAPGHSQVWLVKQLASRVTSKDGKVPPLAIAIEFSNWRVNEPLPADAFVYHPIEETD